MFEMDKLSFQVRKKMVLRLSGNVWNTFSNQTVSAESIGTFKRLDKFWDRSNRRI